MHLGGWEVALLVAVVILIFGPSKLPALGGSLADFFKNFKKGIKEVKKDTDEINDHLK